MGLLPNGESRHDKVNGTTTTAKTQMKEEEQSIHTNGHTSNGESPTGRTMARKASNPLAPPFIVSAPGKTIVYGEHAVVHGKAAIAAAISLRSYLHCTTLTKSQRTVSLKFRDIGLEHTWQIPDLPWQAFQHPAKKKKYYDMVTSLDAELVEAVRKHVENVSPDAEPHMRKVHQDAASAFLYLFLSLGSVHSPACVYALRSAVPISAGLGSSASVTVCMAVALLLQSRALSGPHEDQQSEEAVEQLERINRWAFVGELVIHGNPSGVDNTVATNGHAAFFQRKDYAKPPSVTVLRDFPELPLLLVDTRQSRSTANEVAKVGALREAHPAVAAHILDAIDAISRSAYELLNSEDAADRNSEASIRHLGELMNINHGLLSTLGVSHPRLERLRELVAESGVGWLKLTGAGGGGCAIVLLRPEAKATDTQAAPKVNGNGNSSGKQEKSESAGDFSAKSIISSKEKLQKLQKQLDAEDFATYTTTLGGDGVGVLYPAVLDDEEIDQETFLAAEGREGVEALVGGGKDKEAWKHWRI